MKGQRFIASLLVLITVLSTTAFNNPLVGRYYRSVGHHAVDSTDHDATLTDTAIKTSTTDSVFTPESTATVMSEADSLLLNLDSLKAIFDREHGIQSPTTSGATQWNDSIAAVEDSIRRSRKKSALDAPVM